MVALGERSANGEYKQRFKKHFEIFYNSNRIHLVGITLDKYFFKTPFDLTSL